MLNARTIMPYVPLSTFASMVNSDLYACLPLHLPCQLVTYPVTLLVSHPVTLPITLLSTFCCMSPPWMPVPHHTCSPRVEHVRTHSIQAYCLPPYRITGPAPRMQQSRPSNRHGIPERFQNPSRRSRPRIAHCAFVPAAHKAPTPAQQPNLERAVKGARQQGARGPSATVAGGGGGADWRARLVWPSAVPDVVRVFLRA